MVPVALLQLLLSSRDGLSLDPDYIAHSDTHTTGVGGRKKREGMPYWSSSRVGAVPAEASSTTTAPSPNKSNHRRSLRKGITMEVRHLEKKYWGLPSELAEQDWDRSRLGESLSKRSFWIVLREQIPTDKNTIQRHSRRDSLSND